MTIRRWFRRVAPVPIQLRNSNQFHAELLRPANVSMSQTQSFIIEIGNGLCFYRFGLDEEYRAFLLLSLPSKSSLASSHDARDSRSEKSDAAEKSLTTAGKSGEYLE